MPFYKSLDPSTETGKRTIDGLMRLKGDLDECIPKKCNDKNMLICSWNIREFGGTKYDGRDIEALYYIAEIVSHFDVVAVQEVRDNLETLDKLMSLLGSWWKYLVSDVILGQPGNYERLAFIYDSRKIVLGGLVGELQPKMIKDGASGKLKAEFAFARSPFMAGFRAGWYKFSICTDHFYYGESIPDDPQRVEESKIITDLLKVRANSKDRWASNIILLGDFNIFSLDDPTFRAIEEDMFKIPDGLRGKYTNANKDKPFDQIAFLEAGDVDKVVIKKAGVYDFYEKVYREEDYEVYGFEKEKYKAYRTYKMSDHLPIWVEVDIDFGLKYLEKKKDVKVL